MQAFEFYSPTRILFGPGREAETGAQIKAYGGTRALVVFGGQSAIRSGLLDRVMDSLTRAGVAYRTIGGVKPNPRLALAREGVKRAIEMEADFILAVGGGSVIDTAKAIADGAANPGTDIWDFWEQKVPLTAALPVGVVLTLSAAGSESSASSVLTNWDTRVKRGLSSDLHRPRFAVMNPELTATLPPYQISCGTVDIMMHTMDRYFNPITTNELTDEFAEGLLRTTIRNGKKALEQPGDYQALSELMWAGSQSHNGLTGLGGAMDFAPHQLGHELSAKFDIAHGATLAAVWGSWARYCMDQDPARFARFGRNVFGLDTAGMEDSAAAMAAIEATEDCFRALNMPTCFSEAECGVLTDEALEEMAVRCTFYGKRTIGSFRVLGREDILAIYKLANH